MERNALLRTIRDGFVDRRAETGESQADVGYAVGLSTSHVGNIENGAPASAAAVFDVSSHLVAVEAGLGLLARARDLDALRVVLADVEVRLPDIERRLRAVDCLPVPVSVH